MPRPRNFAPSYLKHKASGRGRFVWTDPAGHRHDKLLPGEYGSKESRDAFQRHLLECQVSPGAASGEEKPEPALTVNEVLLRYLAFATMHYTGRDGGPSSALAEVKLTIRAVRSLYGAIPAPEFGPLKLRAVLQSWVGAGLSRAECNKRLGIAKRIFKWAVAEELVPPEVYQALKAVDGLRKGGTTAAEPEPVGPVDDAAVDATLPFLHRHLRGLVEFQRLTGSRPGEACRVRACDIDTTGPVWLYRPVRHKGTWRGKGRTIAVGPRRRRWSRGSSPTTRRSAYSARGRRSPR
jgi:integrase